MCQTTKNAGPAVPLKYLRSINIKIELFLYDPTKQNSAKNPTPNPSLTYHMRACSFAFIYAK